MVPTTRGQAAVTLLHDSQVKFPYHVPMGDREAPPDWGTIAVCEHAAINKLTNCNIILHVHVRSSVHSCRRIRVRVGLAAASAD